MTEDSQRTGVQASVLLDCIVDEKGTDQPLPLYLDSHANPLLTVEIKHLAAFPPSHMGYVLHRGISDQCPANNTAKSYVGSGVVILVWRSARHQIAGFRLNLHHCVSYSESCMQSLRRVGRQLTHVQPGIAPTNHADVQPPIVWVDKVRSYSRVSGVCGQTNRQQIRNGVGDKWVSQP